MTKKEKSAKEASTTFHSIKAPVSGNPQPVNIPEIGFDYNGQFFKGQITVTPNPKAKGQAKYSVLIDGSKKSYANFSYSFLGLKHNVFLTDSSDNYDSNMNNNIIEAIKAHPDFPFI